MCFICNRKHDHLRETIMGCCNTAGADAVQYNTEEERHDYIGIRLLLSLVYTRISCI